MEVFVLIFVIFCVLYSWELGFSDFRFWDLVCVLADSVCVVGFLVLGCGCSGCWVTRFMGGWVFISYLLCWISALCCFDGCGGAFGILGFRFLGVSGFDGMLLEFVV